MNIINLSSVTIYYCTCVCLIMPVTNAELLEQIHLSGEALCSLFQPHPLKENLCTSCSKLVNKHSAASIPDDETLLRAIEFSQSKERVPSCIEEAVKEGRGGLWHGGFKAVMNHDFLKREHITHIVNTARGLEMFGPKYTAAVEKAKTDMGVKFLNLDWIDTTSFNITDESLSDCCKFIYRARMAGSSVLVHCAQGKSRSTTAVIAHMMVSNNMTYSDALSAVQAKRKMAEPNPTFQQRLATFEKSDIFAALKADLTFPA